MYSTDAQMEKRPNENLFSLISFTVRIICKIGAKIIGIITGQPTFAKHTDNVYQIMYTCTLPYLILYFNLHNLVMLIIVYDNTYILCIVIFLYSNIKDISMKLTDSSK